MANIWDLPEDLLLEVLSLVPTKELICSCRLVCLQWRELVDSALLWKLKYRHHCKDLNRGTKDAYYLLCHFEKNLIKNPCGEEGLDFWEIETPSKGEWKVEVMAGKGKMKVQTTDFLRKNSAGEYKAQHQVNKCFAAYNGTCIKSQRITLKDHGYWDQLMDESRPDINVTDWFFPTPDNEYQLTVKLLAEDFTTLREHFFTDRYGGYWSLGNWRQVTHTFFSCPPGVRHILFQHQGKKEKPFKKCMKTTKSSITISSSYCKNDYTDYYSPDCYGDSDDNDDDLWVMGHGFTDYNNYYW